MNFLMTATPIAMISICGHSFAATANVIAWHTFAMFAPGVFTGFLIRKFGEVTIIMVGLLLEAACIGIALSGIEVFDFWLSMFLLGVGWNFTFTAATSLMTTAYTPAERANAGNDEPDHLHRCRVRIPVFRSIYPLFRLELGQYRRYAVAINRCDSNALVRREWKKIALTT